MDDFTIEMKNLPNDFEFGYDDSALKACLCRHFEEVIKIESGSTENLNNLGVELGKVKTEVKEGMGDYSTNRNLIPGSNSSIPDSKVHEIVDINFGKKDIKEIVYLQRLADIKNEYKTK